MTSSEYYHPSVLFSAKMGLATFAVTQGGIALANTDYGSAWNFWPFKANEATASTTIAAQTPDNLMIVGTRQGKGTIWRATLAGAELIYTATTTNVFTVNNAASGVVSISGPTGGMGQFKGLT